MWSYALDGAFRSAVAGWPAGPMTSGGRLADEPQVFGIRAGYRF